MLSLTIPGRRRTTLPSASTASIPSSWARIGPWRSTWMPPALVAIMPPMVAESRAPRSTPNPKPGRAGMGLERRRGSRPHRPSPLRPRRRPARGRAAGASRSRPAGGPASARGTDPPTSPVLPPCGITAAPAAAQARSTATTSSVDAGRTTASASPRQRPVQSVSYEARRSASVSTWVGPTAARRASSSCSVIGHMLPRADHRLAAMSDRWATFDCYGTLVDWMAGIRGPRSRASGPMPTRTRC